MNDPLDDVNKRIHQIKRKKKFFIVGCQKTGTSWMQSQLNAHPEIACRGEGQFMKLIIPMLNKMCLDYNNYGQIGPDNRFVDEDIIYLLRQSILLLMSKWENITDAKLIGEKTPENALFINDLNILFPESRFIHMIRDGRDVSVSGWFHNLRAPTKKFKSNYQNNFKKYLKESSIPHWLTYIEKARESAQHFPDRYIEIRYENMLQKPKQEIERVLNFLEVDSTEQAVNTVLHAGKFETLSKGRKQGEEDKQSHIRKGIIGDWKNHYDQEAVEIFNDLAGEMMESLGYPIAQFV